MENGNQIEKLSRIIKNDIQELRVFKLPVRSNSKKMQRLANSVARRSRPLSKSFPKYSSSDEVASSMKKDRRLLHAVLDLDTATREVRYGEPFKSTAGFDQPDTTNPPDESASVKVKADVITIDGGDKKADRPSSSSSHRSKNKDEKQRSKEREREKEKKERSRDKQDKSREKKDHSRDKEKSHKSKKSDRDRDREKHKKDKDRNRERDRGKEKSRSERDREKERNREKSKSSSSKAKDSTSSSKNVDVKPKVAEGARSEKKVEVREENGKSSSSLKRPSVDESQPPAPAPLTTESNDVDGQPPAKRSKIEPGLDSLEPVSKKETGGNDIMEVDNNVTSAAVTNGDITTPVEAPAPNTPVFEQKRASPNVELPVSEADTATESSNLGKPPPCVQTETHQKVVNSDVFNVQTTPECRRSPSPSRNVLVNGEGSHSCAYPRRHMQLLVDTVAEVTDLTPRDCSSPDTAASYVITGLRQIIEKLERSRNASRSRENSHNADDDVTQAEADDHSK